MFLLFLSIKGVCFSVVESEMWVCVGVGLCGLFQRSIQMWFLCGCVVFRGVFKMWICVGDDQETPLLNESPCGGSNSPE